MPRWMIRLFFFFFVFPVFLLVPMHPISAQNEDNPNSLSFIVNSQNAFFGLNAGSFTQELRFRFFQQNRQNYLFIDIFDGNQFFTVGAYNSKGLFILIQDHPESFKKNRLTPSEFEDRFFDLLTDYNTLPEIDTKEFSFEKWIIPNSNIIFADKSGSAFVIYSDDHNFQVIENNQPYIGITYQYPFQTFNKYPNSETTDTLYESLLNEIDKTDENFTEEAGIQILNDLQPPEIGLTSVLISPADNQVYISVDNNAKEVWRFDINGGTVETHAGFDQNHKANIPKLGITTSDLKILNFSNENLTVGIIIIAIGILLIILISILIYFPKLSKKHAKIEA